MKIAVIGGGISGLACAYYLQRAGADVRLFEGADRFGGALHSVHEDGFLFECGPQSFLSNDVVLDLVRDLKLESELIRADNRAPRFILLGRRLHRAPTAPSDLLSTPLFGARTKLRLFTEAFRRSRPPDGDEDVASFVRRKFGDDLLENLVVPLVSGIYAGDPEKLSLRAAFPMVHEWESRFGSIIRGAMKSRPSRGALRHGLCSFRDGLSTLPQKLAEALAPRAATRSPVQAIQRGVPAPWKLSVATADGVQQFDVDAVVLATAADRAGKLLTSVSPRSADILQATSYAAVAVVNHGFRKIDISHSLTGFGFLVPPKENLSTLGTVWASSLFPHRAPHGMVTLASFTGGAMAPQEALGDAADIATRVERDIASILGIGGPALKRRVSQYPKALPQYNLGHNARITELRETLSAVPGLFVTGNYLSGPSIGACIAQARQTALDVLSHLGGKSETK